MKRLLHCLTTLLILHLNLSFAQQDIVNGDFEFWDTIPGTNGLEDPLGWTSNNYGIHNCTLGNFITGISKSLDSYSGSYSLKINPSNNPVGFWSNTTVISMSNGNCQFTGGCYSFFCDLTSPTYTSTKLKGFYKYVPNLLTNDSAGLSINLMIQDTTNGALIPVGAASIWFNQAYIWTTFEIEIDYQFGPQQADFIDLAIGYFSNNLSLQPVGYLLIDSLALVPYVPTSLDKKPTVNLKLLPNPVQEKLSLVSNLSFNRFELCDLAGRTIAGGPFEKEMDVGFLSKGIYFVRLQNENQILVEKFVKE